MKKIPVDVIGAGAERAIILITSRTGKRNEKGHSKSFSRMVTVALSRLNEVGDVVRELKDACRVEISALSSGNSVAVV